MNRSMRKMGDKVNAAVQNLTHQPQQKMTMQFKLAMMFFVVMLISGVISVGLLMMIFKPVMKENAVNQMTAFATSAKQMEEKARTLRIQYPEVFR